eukprot:5034599-Amphidinium_carterae.1
MLESVVQADAQLPVTGIQSSPSETKGGTSLVAVCMSRCFIPSYLRSTCLRLSEDVQQTGHGPERAQAEMHGMHKYPHQGWQ